jgi:hypothetical protein
LLLRKKRNPKNSDFALYEINRDRISRQFGNIENLHVYMKENHRDFLAEYYGSVEDVLSPDRRPNTKTNATYVITTAVADSKVDINFLNTLKSYCDKNNATLVIMPCESVTNSFENKTASFDKEFNDPSLFVVTEDVHLNENFSLCSIQVSAKQIKSITGLSRLGNREGSYIFASPKQFLEYIPSGNARGKNYAIMTPGACTKPSYYSETFVSKRLSYIAEKDHTIGAIIVDVIDDKKFDFRQVQADDDGSFNDLGVKYNSDGTTQEVPVNIIFGDLHGVQVDNNALSFFIEKFKSYDIKQVFIHDIFDGLSISHHIQDIAKRARRSESGMDSLDAELKSTYQLLYDIDESLKPKNMNIVKSNHDEFLDRYLSAGNYVADPKNHYLSLKIATALFTEQDVLQHAFETIGLEIPNNWAFLSRHASIKINGVECASHGDLGMNGTRPSMNSLEKIYGHCVVGHNHTASIQRGVFRVGTLSELDMEYNRGPSSWTQSCCLLYDNGQRQLINRV